MLHLKLEQGELAMGTAGNSAKSVRNDRELGQQGASEERIRLVVSCLLSLVKNTCRAISFLA